MLPKDTDKVGVDLLFDYFKYAVSTSERIPSKMRVPRDTFQALCVCAAGWVLGMDKYTFHIYKVCKGTLRRDPPRWDDLDAIIAMRHHHQRLFNIVVQGLAAHVRDYTVEDSAEFQIYLLCNPALAVAIAKLRLAENAQAQCVTRPALEVAQYVVRQTSLEKKWVTGLVEEAVRTAREKAVKAKSRTTRGTQPPEGC